MVAIDPAGRLVAAAWARPPAWIGSIPAAEAWAVAEVLRSTPCRRALITDCLSNLKLAQGGKARACAPTCANARVWSSIFSAVDDEACTTRNRWLT